MSRESSPSAFPPSPAGHGERIPVAVVGASGYSGAELLRFLLDHPMADLVCATSRQEAGRTVGAVFPRFRGHPVADALTFTEPDGDAIAATGARAAFLALPHGVAAGIAVPLLERGLRVIDLSADFRIADPAVYAAFYGADHPAPEWLGRAVYGLPEVHGGHLADARLVASPGCYPTSILLPLIPLVRERLIDHSTLHVASMSGVSGAGKSPSVPLLFAECNESVRPYGVPRHRHLAEIEQELGRAAGEPVVISFTPHLVPVTAGIASTMWAALRPGIDPGAVGNALEEAYGAAPFVRLLGENGFPDTRNVTGTNRIDIGWAHDPRTGRVILMSAEDNLGKGAATQAIQSFNRMHGLPETAALTRF